jgi:CDP-diacylglycerol--glycerol-3-phosphate 3-phosphatidyltransferase
LVIAGWRVNPQLASQTEIAGANLWGKVKTVTQITAIALLLAPLPEIYGQIGMVIFWIAVVLTLISGAIYLFPPANNKVGAG